MALYESNYIDVQRVTAEHTRDSHDTATCGDYYKHARAAAENGRTSSACCVELLEAASDGSGIKRITFGRRFTRKCKSDGFMSTLAKKLGITHDCTLMAGERRCRIA